jgi:hypothetical protein
MPRTLRPTPLAEGTKTFATRGDWSPDANSDERFSRPSEATRRLDAEPPAEGTRRLEEVATEAPRPRRRPGMAVVAVAALLVAGGIGAAVTLANRGPTPAPSASSSPSSTAPNATSVAASTSAAPPVSVSTTASATTSASPSAAVLVRLAVVSSPPATVEIDGRVVGTTPINTSATVGEHRVVLRPRGLGERFERRVTLTPSAGAEVRGDFNDEPSIVVRKTSP